MSPPVTRRAFVAAAGVGALAGCLGGGSSGDGSAEERPGEGPPTASTTLPLPDEPAALRGEAVSGGPPKDGIPAIDEPSFEPAGAVGDRLAPGDPVFGVAVGGDARAYPQAILVHHEICNDVVDGEPVSVTYCPLTGTAMGYRRGGTTFGVSGRLINNNLVMYDRATETWWPQVLGTTIPGPWNEDPPIRSLDGFRVVWTTWERWRRAHPESQVLTRDTGHARFYGSDPYGDYNPRRGYYEPDAPPMFGLLNLDDRFEPKTVFVGARTGAGAMAVRKDRLRGERVVEGDLGGTPHVAVHDPVLDTGYVYRNQRRRRVVPDGEGYLVDGSPHPADDLPLERVLALDAMWFAWIGFYPGSTVYG